MSDEKQLDPKRGLIVKLCEIMAAVGYLQKKGRNTSNQNYSYIREADVVAKMRDEFASRNIFIFPSLVHHENVKLSKVNFKGEVSETYQTNIVMRWTIVDGDTGQERVCEIPGSSASPGDKGVYVAMTGSEKYLLMKSFLLPTGDDPESDENEERGSKEAAKAVANKKIADFKAKKSAVPPTCLFYVLPENHNGHQAELINVKEYGEHLNEVAAEGLRLILKKYVHLGKKNGELLIPNEKMGALAEELQSCGVDLKQLPAAREANAGR